MQITQLSRYDFPEDMIANWRKLGIQTLQPIQVQAIQKHKLFDGNSMIVSAPTSSGKTFIGELAAVYQAINKKKTAFLVPLKAIAEEKFQTFRQMYSSSGIKVVISTRDHKEYDSDIENGKFDIAIIVYEKFFQLLNCNKTFLNKLGLVVVDELQMLADISRGPTLEMILTHLRMQREQLGFQLVGLSAVLGNHRLVNEWLDIDLLHYERRPVELRIGYLYQGVFHYRTMNSPGTGDETILKRPPEDRAEVLYAAVTKFSEDGEQSLLFLKDKNSVRGVAKALIQWINAPSATDAIAELETLEETHSRDELMELLQHGIALHHADLTIEERELVERHYRNRSILVLVSTSTLAMGVNLPTRNVFIELQQWRYDPKFKKLDTVDLSKGEFENMGGRAGRYQLEDEFGRAIALAHSIVEREQIRRFYLEGELEEVKPNLWRSSMATTVLGVVSLLGGGSTEQIKSYLRNSLSWHVHEKDAQQQEELNQELDCGLNYCLRAGVVSGTTGEKLTLTEFGTTVVSMGIRVETAHVIKQWLSQRDDQAISCMEAVLFALLTADGQEGYVNFSTSEYHYHGYEYTMRVTEQIGSNGMAIFDSVCSNNIDQYNRAKTCKSALLLNDYIGSSTNKELEKRYQIYLGAIRRMAEQIAWVLSSAAELAKTLGYPNSWRKSLDQIAMQVQYGVPNAGIALAQLQIPRLGRERIRKLVAAGLTEPQQILEAGAAVLAKYVTKPVATSLLAWCKHRTQAVELETALSDTTDTNTSSVSIENKGHHNVVVGVNHGTIIMNPRENTQVKKAEPPVDLSTLPLTSWKREVSQRLESLTPEALEQLYEETRATRHDRIRAACNELKAMTSIADATRRIKQLKDEYVAFTTLLNDTLHAIVIPSFISDFTSLLRSRASFDTVRNRALAVFDSILVPLNGLIKLLESFRVSPEELLLEAVQRSRPVLNGTNIDSDGLLDELQRTERFLPKQQLVEAFGNLLRNAGDSLHNTDDPIIVLSSRIESNQTCLTIRDNGCGISPEQHESIFNNGFSTKDTEGFGLARVKHTLQSLGGDVRLVESEPNVGTTFEVVL